MADLAFPWLEDCDRRVRLKVQQPRELAGYGQPSFEEADFENAYNKAYEEVCRELALMDRQYQSEYLDVTIGSGVTEYALPARTQFLRMAKVMDSQGREVFRIRTSTSDEVGWYGNGEAAQLRPDRNSITFTTPTTKALTVRLYYGVYYVPLLHGCARDGGGSTIQLANYSSVEDNLYTGLILRIVEGTGIGQERTITTYSGSTQTATVSLAWVTVPDDTSRYTSRPDLPWLAKDVFENLSIACLFEKLNEDSAAKFYNLAQAKLGRMRAAVKLQERREPDYTLDTNLHGGWGDPADTFNY